MKLRCKIILVMVFLSKYSCINSVIASTLSAISITNNVNQAMVTLDCTIAPMYTIFSLHTPERIVIDLLNTSKMQKNIFPISFNGANLVKCVRTNISANNRSVRIVLDLICPAHIETITQKQIKESYCVTLTIIKKNIFTVSDVNIRVEKNTANRHVDFNINKVTNNKKAIMDLQLNKSQQNQEKRLFPIIVAIDAGHGGQDPGATGYHGIYEKNITINIAKKLKLLLDLDPRFKAVLVRNGDYFLSVMERSDVARKKKANVLVSIHTDSTMNTKIRGASVWVLSNRRAKSETIHWLQRSEKHSELLGGLGDILINYRSDPYFNHLVLDLQFGYAQRVGYDIALHVLHQLKNVTSLHKKRPEYSSFGVLRSPDIPSILVETGFISNIEEECLLASNGYQEKIANALYKGLCAYFINSQKNSLDNSVQTKKLYHCWSINK